MPKFYRMEAQAIYFNFFETEIIRREITEDLEELNSDENVIIPSRLKESDKITTTLTMDKETYDWLTTPGEDDDVGCLCPEQVTELDEESFDKFAKEVYDKEVDTEKVKACKKMFEGIENVDIKIEK